MREILIIFVGITLFLAICVVIGIFTEQDPLYRYTWYQPDGQVVTFIGVPCGNRGNSFCIKDPDTHNSFTISGSVKVEFWGMNQTLWEKWNDEQ